MWDLLNSFFRGEFSLFFLLLLLLLELLPSLFFFLKLFFQLLLVLHEHHLLQKDPLVRVLYALEHVILIWELLQSLCVHV